MKSQSGENMRNVEFIPALFFPSSVSVAHPIKTALHAEGAEADGDCDELK